MNIEAGAFSSGFFLIFSTFERERKVLWPSDYLPDGRQGHGLQNMFCRD